MNNNDEVSFFLKEGRSLFTDDGRNAKIVTWIGDGTILEAVV